jgi:hypothetical protein
VIDVLREVHQAVQDALARGDPALDGQLPDKLRQRYDEAVAFGITHNRHRDWHDGNHPGYALGCWLRDCKEQVWLFTTQFAVEWTNEGASYCTSWVRSAVSVFLRWSARCVNSVAWGSDILGQRAGEAGVVAAA